MTGPGEAGPIPVDLLITGGFVLTLDPNNSSIYPGSIVVRGGEILDLGPSREIDPRYHPRQRMDAQDHVAMPGLVNIHGHASNSLIRGLGADLALEDWLARVCWPCMAEASDEDIYNGVLLSCLEMLQNGVTTFADMWPGVDLAAAAVAVSGQRAMLAHNIKDFGDPRRGEDELGLGLEAWGRWNGHAGGRVRVGLGPHSVYTCHPDLLADCAAVASEKGIHLQIHGSETALEVENSRAQHGRSPIELMDEIGLLGRNTIVAHAVHIDETDVGLLQSSGSAVAHNITSNLKLASGVAPVRRLIERGVPVGLGTDGPGSNDGLDLLRDLRTAALVQKGVSGDPAVLPAVESLKMATTSGAAALGLDGLIGSLEIGKKADLILLNFDRPHLTPRNFDLPQSVASLLLYAATGADVDTVVIDGRVLVRGGKPLGLDTDTILRQAQKSGMRVRAAARFD